MPDLRSSSDVYHMYNWDQYGLCRITFEAVNLGMEMYVLPHYTIDGQMEDEAIVLLSPCVFIFFIIMRSMMHMTLLDVV